MNRWWENSLVEFENRFSQAESNKTALIKTKEMLENSIEDASNKVQNYEIKKELHMKAIAVLDKLSNDAVDESFRFIEDNLNDVLAKIFVNSSRKIKLVTSVARGKIPELSIELYAANGIKRDLKEDSGHGIRQLVSLLCIMCLITITGSRKFLVLDEVLTGLSRESRMAVNDILWSFADIGFQFMIVEHGFIPKGAQVYRLELHNDVSEVVNEYIEPNGFYLMPAE